MVCYKADVQSVTPTLGRKIKSGRGQDPPHRTEHPHLHLPESQSHVPGLETLCYRPARGFDVENASNKFTELLPFLEITLP